LRQQTRSCAPAQAVPFGRAEKHSQRMHRYLGHPLKLLDENREAGFRVPSGMRVGRAGFRVPRARRAGGPFGRAEKHSQRMHRFLEHPLKPVEERYKPRCFANRTRCLGKAQTRTRPAGAHSSPALGAGVFTESRRLLGAALCTPASD